MSFVFAVSLGIFARIVPGFTSSPSATIMWAPDGSEKDLWWDFFPSSMTLILASLVGSLGSMATRWLRPVT